MTLYLRHRRGRVFASAFLTLLAALLISTGLAWADHQPNHDPAGGGGQADCLPSDPDGGENGGADCEGGEGGLTDDKDPNNGSGNDEDCEDDNNGVGIPAHCLDVCPELNGVQRDASACAPPVDVCPQLDGVQTDPSDCAPELVDVCPQLDGVQTDAADCAPDNSDNDPVKVSICHATGSDTNPYVVIEISENGLNGHLNEQHVGDLEDIYPVPAGGCPTTTGGESTDVCPDLEGLQTDPSLCAPDVTDLCPDMDGVQTDAAACAPVNTGGETPTPTPTGGETPTAAGGETPTAAGAETPTGAAPDETPVVAGVDDEPNPVATAGVTDVPAGAFDGAVGGVAAGELPFTGAETWIVALIGAALTGAGLLLHLRPTPRARRSTI